jgi:hypothetical protein
MGIYYEGHHIIPLCVGGTGRSGDKNHPNIVLLTAKEHYIAHRLLCEIYPDSNGLKMAIWRMINGTKSGYKLSPKMYARLKEHSARERRLAKELTHHIPNHLRNKKSTQVFYI